MTSKEALERLVEQANARKLSNKIVVNRWDYEKLLELAEKDALKKVRGYIKREWRRNKIKDTDNK